MTDEGRPAAGGNGLGVAGRVAGAILDRIDDADEQAAAERARELRAAHPDETPDELVERLIKKKCQQTAAIGAATSGTALVPGLGTLVALTVGAAADIGLTLRLQAELVLEIAAIHGHVVSPEEKRGVVLLVSGLGLGGNRLLSRGGAKLAEAVGQRFAQRWLTRAIPVAGAAAAAGANALSTYVIGRRAHAYFGRGPEAMGDWRESLRTLSGVDERKLAAWLAEGAGTVTRGTGRTWEGVRGGAQRAAATTAGAARRGVAGAVRRTARWLPRRRDPETGTEEPPPDPGP
jgi:uncharacterized protein (DUF697 family)